MNELQQNFFGLPVDLSRLTSLLGLLADFVVYGVVLCLAYRALLPKVSVPGSSEEVVTKRRLLLSRAGIAVLSVGGLAGTGAWFVPSYSSRKILSPLIDLYTGESLALDQSPVGVPAHQQAQYDSALGNKPIPSFRLFFCDFSIPCFRQKERSPLLVLWLIQHEEIISVKRHVSFSLFLLFQTSFSSIGET